MIRTFAGAFAVALMLVVAGCGDDEEPSGEAATTAPAAPTQTVPSAEVPDAEGDAASTSEQRETSPEDQPGGAGDEEAARSEAVLELGAKGLSPREVRVAPYIAVKLIVRSDGTEYDLSYRAPGSSGGATGTGTAEFEIDGLRPGEAVTVEERNTGSRARIVASDAAGP